MLRKITAIILVIAFTLNYGFVFSQEILSLEPLLKEAKENNPDILAAKKRWESAKARIPQAKSLEDPTLEFKFEKTPGSPFQLNKTMSEDRMLSFAQFLPFFGKLSLKGKIALVESQMFAAEYKSKELEVINQTKNAYFDLFMNYKEAGLNQEILILLEGVIKVAEAKYAVGDMSQEEIYKLHSEAASLKNKIENLQEEKLAKQTTINTLLNKDPEGSLGVPELSEVVSFNKDIRGLYQAALLNQPELIIFSYAIEKNKYAKSLAKRSFFPDLMAKIAERGFTTGTIGPWDLMLSFTLPIWFWTKQRYEVKEAIANLEEAEAAYKAMQNRAFAEVKDLAVKIITAKNKIKLYKTDLIPILENSLEVSLASFSSGGGDFMSLIDTQRMLVETKMGYYKLLVEYNMALADLERTVGLNFNEKTGAKK
jgi:outer membrane protein TolC